MNTAKIIQEKWGATPAEMARRLAISPATAKRWLAGGNPKDVGGMLLKIAEHDPAFDARKLSTRTRKKYTTSEWVAFLMGRFGDFRLAQFARRLNLNFATVRTWSKSPKLKGTAETLLLYAFHHPEQFPEK